MEGLSVFIEGDDWESGRSRSGGTSIFPSCTLPGPLKPWNVKGKIEEAGVMDGEQGRAGDIGYTTRGMWRGLWIKW